jgi:hypothetical protein
MSTPTVIKDVSDLLMELLKSGLTSSGNPNPSIQISSPVDAPECDLSIWLYQVTPNEHLRNAPNVRLNNDDSEQLTPLPLDLYYLLTPLRPNESQNQMTLGRALRVIYDHAILPLNAADNIEELRLSICQRSIEELAKVWEAMQAKYRLSVCFEVRSVRIDSERVLKAGRIRERATDFEELPAEQAA